MKVQDVMCRAVQSCRPDEDLNRAAQLMWDHDCGVVPVVNEASVVQGVVTDRDVCMAAYTQGVPLSSIRVGNVMSRQVQSCAPASNVEIALSIMKEARVRRLPVIDAGGRLVGILSLNDLARAAALPHGQGDRQFASEIAGVLAVICSPRGSRRMGSETQPREPALQPPGKLVGGKTR